ncbi:hypothetical protein IFM89_010246 [Coptis chinensis]|uniref:Uncharacterized protein n=1 Tax=Coptis chinensis TaxID=261450 RepID=A0A835ILC2_9MAGN|nr:hypothetical protein IFM89_010246 [Coptis chinensis]
MRIEVGDSICSTFIIRSTKACLKRSRKFQPEDRLFSLSSVTSPTLFQEAPTSTLEKVPWEQVVAMADQVSKQATIAGLLWKEATTELQALEET